MKSRRRKTKKKKNQEEGRYNETIVFHVIAIPEGPFLKKEITP
jgi:hypothetical protein